MNPQNASNAEIGRPIFDTDMGTEKGPINTGHRVNSLQRWPNASLIGFRPSGNDAVDHQRCEPRLKTLPSSIVMR